MQGVSGSLRGEGQGRARSGVVQAGGGRPEVFVIGIGSRVELGRISKAKHYGIGQEYLREIQQQGISRIVCAAAGGEDFQHGYQRGVTGIGPDDGIRFGGSLAVAKGPLQGIYGLARQGTDGFVGEGDGDAVFGTTGIVVGEVSLQDGVRDVNRNTYREAATHGIGDAEGYVVGAEIGEGEHGIFQSRGVGVRTGYAEVPEEGIHVHALVDELHAEAVAEYFVGKCQLGIATDEGDLHGVLSAAIVLAGKSTDDKLRTRLGAGENGIRYIICRKATRTDHFPEVRKLVVGVEVGRLKLNGFAGTGFYGSRRNFHVHGAACDGEGVGLHTAIDIHGIEHVFVFTRDFYGDLIARRQNGLAVFKPKDGSKLHGLCRQSQHGIAGNHIRKGLQANGRRHMHQHLAGSHTGVRAGSRDFYRINRGFLRRDLRTYCLGIGQRRSRRVPGIEIVWIASRVQNH